MNPVSRELFDERTFHINRKLDDIKSLVEPIPELKLKVDAHEKFICKIKYVGIRILWGLALSGALGVSSYAIISESLKAIPLP